MTGVRVAIVGASGWAGSRHVAAFAAQGATIAALIDHNPATRSIAEAHGAAVVDSIDEISTAEIDLVVVSLPTSIQPAIVRSLLERGFRVLEEKPIASDIDAAAELASAPHVEERLMVGYTLHHHPAVPLLRAWLEESAPISISVRSVARKIAVESWRASPAEGGVLVINGIHAIELVSSLLGSDPLVRSVHTSSELYGSGVPEYVAATLEFVDGPVFRLETYWGPWENSEGLNAGDWDLTFDIVAPHGRFLWRNDAVSVWQRNGTETRTEWDPTDLFLSQAAVALEFARGASPLVGYQSALRATRVASTISAHQEAAV